MGGLTMEVMFLTGFILAVLVALAIFGSMSRKKKKRREFADYIKRLKSKSYEKDYYNYGKDK